MSSTHKSTVVWAYLWVGTQPLLWEKQSIEGGQKMLFLGGPDIKKYTDSLIYFVW